MCITGQHEQDWVCSDWHGFPNPLQVMGAGLLGASTGHQSRDLAITCTLAVGTGF